MMNNNNDKFEIIVIYDMLRNIRHLDEDGLKYIYKLLSTNNGYANYLKRSIITINIKNGRLDAIKYIETFISDYNEYIGFYLIDAAIYGQLEIVKHFYKHGANLSIYGDNAMSAAISCGHLEIVEFLHKKGVEIKYTTNLLENLFYNEKYKMIGFLHGYGKIV
jgi:hypothetical protein